MERHADDILVAQARQGDRWAFGLLVERHQRMAMDVARQIVHSEDDARELVQEGLLQAYLSLDRLRRESSFSSWLHGIVRNLSLNHVRQRRPVLLIDPTEETTADLFPNREPDPHQVAETRELHLHLRRAIDGLSPQQRSATWLFYCDGLNLQEIAAHLDLSVTAVKSRLFKSRNRLKELLAETYPELRRLRKKRRTNMVRVSIADIIPAPKEGYYFAMLLDEASQQVLPVVVPTRKTGTGLNLGQNPQAEIQAPDLLADVLKAVGVELQEVRLEELSEDILYAVLKMRNGKTVNEVQARPDEALALAAHRDCPIYIDASALEKMGQTIPKELRAPENQIQALIDFAFTFDRGGPVSDLFKRVWQYAREEAAHLNSDCVDSEHLLLGILRADEGTAATILKRLDQDPDELRRFIEGNAAKPVSDPRDGAFIPFAPLTQRIMATAKAEAYLMREEIVGTGHLLLALSRETQGGASMCLALKGILYTNVRHWPLRGEDPHAFWQD